MAIPIDSIDREGVEYTLSGLVQLMQRGISMQVNVSAPASIVSYNPTTQKAVVEIGYLPIANTESGTKKLAPIKVFDVPVNFPGSQDNYLTFPILPGSTGMVRFVDRCLSEWLRLGKATDPISSRVHNISDCTFTLDLRPTSDALPATDLTSTVLEGDVVKLGRNATDFVVLAQALHDYLTALVTAGTPVVGTDGGAALKTTMLAYLTSNPFTSFASTKVRSE